MAVQSCSHREDFKRFDQLGVAGYSALVQEKAKFQLYLGAMNLHPLRMEHKVNRIVPQCRNF